MKNSLIKKIGIGITTSGIIFGAKKILAQNLNNTLPNTLKNKIEISQPPTYTTKKNDQIKVGQNRLIISKSARDPFNVLSNGINLVRVTQDINITPKTEFGLDSILSAQEGDVSYEIIDIKKGLTNIKKFVQNDKTRIFGKLKNNIVSKFQRMINYVQANPLYTSTDYNSSVTFWDNVFRDGKISAKTDGFVVNDSFAKEAKEGLYTLLIKSKATRNQKANIVPVLIKINLKQNEFEPNTTYGNQGLKSYLTGRNLSDPKGNPEGNFYTIKVELARAPKNTLDLRKLEEIVNKTIDKRISVKTHPLNLYLSRIRKLEAIIDKRISGKTLTHKVSKILKPSKASIIIGAAGNDKFLEGQFGVQYGPVAALLNYGHSKDENILNAVTDPSINGRYAEMKENNTDMRFLGVAGELHAFSNKKISPFIGGGINTWNYTTEKKLNIMKGDQVLKSNTDSKTNSKNSWKTYGGLDVNIKNSKLGLQIGYDSKAKFFAGTRYSLKLGK